MNILNEYLAPSAPPPLMPPVPEKRVWGAWATIGFTLVIIVAFTIVQGIVIIIPTLDSMLSHAGAATSAEDLLKLIMDDLNLKLGLWQSIATIVSGIIGAGLILVFIRARKGMGIGEYLGIKKISIKAALAAVGITIAYIAIANGLQALIGGQADENIMNQVYDTSVSPPLFWIAVIIFAPLFEEALFRGFMFEGLRRSWLGVYGAVMLTSFGWSLLHGLQYSVSGIIYIFLLSIIMGVIRWKTGNIWSTFIMHAVVNLIATISLATGFGF